MTRTYLVHLPKAEARYLAGTGPAGPATLAARARTALRDWLHGVSRSRRRTVPVAKVVADLTVILSIAPAPMQQVRGPLRSRRAGPPPGRAEYLGDGTVRLDEAAISTLSGLREGEDFRITFSNAGPVLAVGTDRYIVDEEEPDPKP